MATVLSPFFVSAADLDGDVVGCERASVADGNVDFAQDFRRNADLLDAAPTDSETLIAFLRDGLRSQAQESLVRKASARGRLAEHERSVDLREGDVVEVNVGIILKSKNSFASVVVGSSGSGSMPSSSHAIRV